jgi:hypothetical protein
MRLFRACLLNTGQKTKSTQATWMQSVRGRIICAKGQRCDVVTRVRLHCIGVRALDTRSIGIRWCCFTSQCLSWVEQDTYKIITEPFAILLLIILFHCTRSLPLHVHHHVILSKVSQAQSSQDLKHQPNQIAELLSCVHTFV